MEVPRIHSSRASKQHRPSSLNVLSIQTGRMPRNLDALPIGVGDQQHGSHQARQNCAAQDSPILQASTLPAHESMGRRTDEDVTGECSQTPAFVSPVTLFIQTRRRHIEEKTEELVARITDEISLTRSSMKEFEDNSSGFSSFAYSVGGNMLHADSSDYSSTPRCSIDMLEQNVGLMDLRCSKQVATPSSDYSSTPRCSIDMLEQNVGLMDPRCSKQVATPSPILCEDTMVMKPMVPRPPLGKRQPAHPSWQRHPINDEQPSGMNQLDASFVNYRMWRKLGEDRRKLHKQIESNSYLDGRVSDDEGIQSGEDQELYSPLEVGSQTALTTSTATEAAVTTPFLQDSKQRVPQQVCKIPLLPSLGMQEAVDESMPTCSKPPASSFRVCRGVARIISRYQRSIDLPLNGSVDKQ